MARFPKDTDEIIAALTHGDYVALSPFLRPILAYLLANGYHVRDVAFDSLEENRFDVIVDRPIPEEMRKLVTPSEAPDIFDDSADDGTHSIGFLCPSTYQTIIW